MPQNFQIGYRNITWFGEIPNRCPICHHKVTIGSPVQAQVVTGPGIEAVFACPSIDCLRYFIGHYSIEAGQHLELQFLNPIVTEVESFPDSVSSLSPDFIKIYGQSSEALECGLNQIAGPGFRKAFEFLIKDYAVAKAGSDKEETILGPIPFT